MYQRWLAAFHAVARSGGFTSAARVLNIGQPTVSTHVQALEDHFGVELFYRRGRVVELTEMGKQLLTITHGLFGHEEEAIQLLRAVQAREIGSLRVGAVGPWDTMEISAALLRKHPDLQLVVAIKTSSDVLDGLLKFDLDVGVIGHEPQDARFLALLYNRYPFQVVVNIDHPLSRRRTIRIEELDGLNFVHRERGTITRTVVDEALGRAGIKVRPVMETDTRESSRTAVVQGIGISIWPATEAAWHNRLKLIPISNADMFAYAYVVCLTERRNRPLIASFLHHAKEGVHRARKTRNPGK
jgi:LysR family transcriptional regulator, low CO2-responsive transcriptional regulator